MRGREQFKRLMIGVGVLFCVLLALEICLSHDQFRPVAAPAIMQPAPAPRRIARKALPDFHLKPHTFVLANLNRIFPAFTMDRLSTFTREFHQKKIMALVDRSELISDRFENPIVVLETFKKALEITTRMMEILSTYRDDLNRGEHFWILDFVGCQMGELQSAILNGSGKLDRAYLDFLVTNELWIDAAHWCRVRRLGWDQEVYYLRQGGAEGRSLLAWRSNERLYKAGKRSLLSLGPDFHWPAIRPED